MNFFQFASASRPAPQSPFSFKPVTTDPVPLQSSMKTQQEKQTKKVHFALPDPKLPEHPGDEDPVAILEYNEKFLENYQEWLKKEMNSLETIEQEISSFYSSFDSQGIVCAGLE